MDELQIVSAVLQIAGRYSLSRSFSTYCSSISDTNTSKSDRLYITISTSTSASTFTITIRPVLMFSILPNYIPNTFTITCALCLSPSLSLNFSSLSSSRRRSPVRRRRRSQWRQQRWLGRFSSGSHCPVRLVAPQHRRTSIHDNYFNNFALFSFSPLLCRHILTEFVILSLLILFIFVNVFYHMITFFSRLISVCVCLCMQCLFTPRSTFSDVSAARRAGSCPKGRKLLTSCLEVGSSVLEYLNHTKLKNKGAIVCEIGIILLTFTHSP